MSNMDVNFYAECDVETFMDRNLSIIGIGSEGVCYKYGDRVIKVLSGPNYCTVKESNCASLPFACLEIDDDSLPSKEYIMRYSTIKNSTFVFADGIFWFNKKLRGLVMPYISIPKLCSYKISSTRFDCLINACKNCVQDIELISSLGIEIVDYADVNIYFDGKKFQFGDTMDYIDHEDNLGISEMNIRGVSKTLISYFTRGSIKKSLKLNRNMLSLYQSKDYVDDPVFYFTELRSHLSNVCDEQIDSFSTAQKILQKKMKL